VGDQGAGYSEERIGEFLDAVASGSSVPGGGSVSALAGAAGAALAGMVARLTLGKSRYRDVQRDMEELAARADALRAELLELVDEDAAAFREVMAAYKVPGEGTDRRKAIRTALERAAEVPLRTAEACVEVQRLATVAARLGNENALTDALVGASLAEAGAKGAVWNIAVNLREMEASDFVRRTTHAAREVLSRSARVRRSATALAARRLPLP